MSEAERPNQAVDTWVDDQQRAASYVTVIARIVQLIHRDCGQDKSGIVIQGLLVVACHFSKVHNVKPDLMKAFIDQQYPVSTQAVTEAVTACFGPINQGESN